MADSMHENDPFLKIVDASWDISQETMDQLVLKSHDSTMNFVNWFRDKGLPRDIIAHSTTFMVNNTAPQIGLSPERYMMALDAIMAEEELQHGQA
jgi:hypothetical protein